MILFLRAVRAWQAAAVTGVGAAVAYFAVRSLPDHWIYRYLPSVGWGVLASGVAMVVAAGLVSLPRLEGFDATAARRLAIYRGAVTVSLYGCCLLLGGVTALAAGSHWFLLPVASAALVAAATVLAVGALLPAEYVVVAGTAYTMACCMGSRGTQWWDLMLSPPSTGRFAVAAAFACVGAIVFISRGARSTTSSDDL